MALEVRGKSIRVTISHRGETIRFTWPETANAASIARAKRVQDRIKRDLEDDAFRSVDDYLPNTAKPTEFGVYAKAWLRGHGASPATREEYRKALNKYWLGSLGQAEIGRLRPADIREVISQQSFPSAKTKNNALIPLRQILHQAYVDEIAIKDFTPFIKAEKFQKKPPDPFSQEEAERIIEHFKETHWHNYFEFMFYSGLRTGEGVGLCWGDVDLTGGSVRIHQSQSKGRSLNTTKTNRARYVQLNPRSEAALKRQRSVRLPQCQRVFVTEKGEGYKTEKAQRGAFTKALKDLGIRHRPAYRTRASFISWNLMLGNPVDWVADQCGNSPTVIYQHYAKWIPSDKDKEYADRLCSTHISTDLGPEDDASS